MKKKRNLAVASEEKAIELMKAFLASQLIEIDLDKDEGTGSTFIKLAWVNKNWEGDEWLGCPCFVADFHGKTHDLKKVHGVVYVKTLPTQTTEITKMEIVEDELSLGLDFIEDGTTFSMRDIKHRYKDEKFIFKNGEISRLG
ncbi:MAG: hypothetical protein E7019_04645 [Alphaproteobacteria bacterium]|nr:hypothetical protein [Alphaproteobacteria bacterium]